MVWLWAFALVALVWIQPTSALADSCTISERGDTSANVRRFPNGPIVNRLKNGRVVELVSRRYDSQRRPWYFAQSYFQGRLRKWGWIFHEALSCGGNQRKARGTGKIIRSHKLAGRSCVVRDPEGVLNVRDEPNGNRINGLRNGRTVRLGALQYDTKRRPWYFVTGRHKGRNRNWGWVFGASLQCRSRKVVTPPKPTAEQGGGQLYVILSERFIAENQRTMRVRCSKGGTVILQERARRVWRIRGSSGSGDFHETASRACR